jgi:hypothetical protein
MRTLIDLPEEDIAKIKKITEEQGISRAEFVRRAVRQSLEPQQKVDRNQFFGLWARNRDPNDPPLEDGLAYQLRMRAEWDREWD